MFGGKRTTAAGEVTGVGAFVFSEQLNKQEIERRTARVQNNRFIGIRTPSTSVPNPCPMFGFRPLFPVWCFRSGGSHLPVQP